MESLRWLEGAAKKRQSHSADKTSWARARLVRWNILPIGTASAFPPMKEESFFDLFGLFRLLLQSMESLSHPRKREGGTTAKGYMSWLARHGWLQT
ncbi:MAG: hypothetical protein Q9157_005193 [Trypethelium eluteriae]